MATWRNKIRRFHFKPVNFFFIAIIVILDIVIAPTGNIWDFAAPSILTKEAGGIFTDFDGNPKLTTDSAVTTNGLLHSEVLHILNK